MFNNMINIFDVTARIRGSIDIRMTIICAIRLKMTETLHTNIII